MLLLLALWAAFRRRFGKLYSRLMNVYEGLSLRGKIKQLIALYQIITPLEVMFLVPMPPAVASLLDRLPVASAGSTCMPSLQEGQHSKAAEAFETCTRALSPTVCSTGALGLFRLLRSSNGLP